MVTDNPSLVEARLRALARTCADVELDTVDASLGAGRAGGRGFYVVEDDPRAVGRVLRWAVAQTLESVELLALTDAPDLARRAALVAATDQEPTVTVWQVDGADAVIAEPRDVVVPPELPSSHWALAGLMTEAGARAVDDHGVLVVEVAGLEVGRVLDSADGPRIELGVGLADRELNQLIHRDTDIGAGLRRVIAAAVEYRTGHVHHPLTRIGRERWLRSMLLDDPSLVGATTLEPVVPLRPRHGLLAATPSAAAGTLESGEPVMVLTMVGVDLDLVPEAADYRNRWNPEATIRLVTPARDLALSTSLVSRLSDAEAIAIEGPWVS